MKGDSLVGTIGAWLLRPRVIHSLPGRLRLHIPALKRLPIGPHPAAFCWRDLHLGPHRIQEVEVNLTTGNLLIRYPERELDEAEVLAFLQTLTRLALRHRKELEAVSGQRLPEVLKRLATEIGRAARSRLELSEEIKIPDHVWA